MNGSRIWDLRRGDLDDNRTSIRGNVRSMVVSAALEFNYLNASIGFLTLVVGPALLVGIVPPLVIAYGRMKLGVAAGQSLTVALLMLALLTGLAFWIGRPLLSMAVESFWRLHYNLIVPIYVAVRELLRVVVEKFSGSHSMSEKIRPEKITPEEIDRGRRLGTILGGSLLAGGGLALAIAVGLSFGVQLVHIDRIELWPVARATLGCAAVVFGLSTAAESLYWVWQELTICGSVQDWTPGPNGHEAASARVAHLSDLHIVGERYGYRMESGTRGPRGNHGVRMALHKLAEIHESAPFDRILVTGDVTDAGTRAEWVEFIDFLRDYPLRDRLSFVPGNHDVNIVDRNNPARFELPWSAGRPLRKLRVVLALDAIQGDRARVVDRASGALGPFLNEYLREGDRAERLRELAESGAPPGRKEMASVWDGIFPLVEAPRESDGYGLILLDSNARSHFALTNAIGVVSPSQLKALQSILNGSPRCGWIILLHHQIVEYPVTSVSLTDRIGLALVNAPAVLNTIAPHAPRCLVMHGHRHRDWIGASRDLVLCSAPSVTMGCYGQELHRGSFHVHEVVVGGGGSIRLKATERVTL